MICDAHLHSSHPPLLSLKEMSPEGLYLSCASAAEDWQPLLDSKKIIPFLGIHPEKIDKQWQSLLTDLESVIKNNPLAGIGECGLDRRFYRSVPRAEQEKVLRRQLEIAEEYKRPVVLHQVGAPGALADLITQLKPAVPLMIHGFKESTQILKRYINLNMYISLGPGRHWENEEFLKTARLIPHKNLLLETDWPYCIKPEKTSGDSGKLKSYSECLSEHYKTVSARLGIDISPLSRLVKENGTLFTN